MGDFNSDGKMDWGVANGYDDNLWLYIGKGDGTSALPTILPLKGTSPVWVATADLRKLGRSDIIVAEHESNAIGILLSNGDGTFQPEQQLAVSGPDFVTTADVNGDGSLDIVAGATGCASVFLGNGHGAYQSAIQSCATPISQQAGYSAPAFTTFLSFADFNKDGKLDILISNPNVGVGMLTGDGSGHFSSPVQIVSGNVQLGYFYFTSAAIDFNGDGCPDAAAGDLEGKVFLFAGDCAGNFKHPAALSLVMGDVPAQLSVADINGDGHPDLVASGLVSIWGMGASAGHLLMVALGDGQVGFQHSQVYRAGEGLVGFAVGDLNGDSKPDVLAVAQDDDALYEFLNDGTGNFGAPQGRSQFSTHGNNNQEAYINNGGSDSNQLLADVNGDGKKDVVYIDYADLEKTWSVAASLNLGASGFADPVFSAIDTDGTQVSSDALGDFHGTGQPDMIVTTLGSPGGSQVYLMQNLGNGKFGPPQAVFSRSIVADGVFATDLNKDGKQDLLVFEIVGSSCQLDVLLGNGNGTFQPAVSYSLPSTGEYGTFFAGDFNGDGKPDVLLYLGQNVLPRVADIVEFLGNGDGTLQPGRTLLGTPGLPPISIADLNHDGRVDILAPDPSGTPAITTYFGQSDGSFSGPETYNSFSGTNASGVNQAPIVGDFNLDGNIDVLIPQLQSNANGSDYVWAQFYTSNQAGSLIPTADILPSGGVQPLWMVASMDASGASSLVEFNNLSLSFDVMAGTTAPPFQLFQSEEIVGGALNGVVALNQTASADTTITLQTSDPTVGGQNSVIIPAGSSSANYTLYASSGTNTTNVVAVTATLGSYSTTAYSFDEAAVAPISVEAPNLTFTQTVGTTSAPLTVKVINNTAGPAMLSNITLGSGYFPDFSETDNCHTAISGFGTCTFSVTFAPSGTVKNEIYQLSFTDPANNLYTYSFSGTSGQAVAVLYPASVAFGSQAAGTVSPVQSAYISETQGRLPSTF